MAQRNLPVYTKTKWNRLQLTTEEDIETWEYPNAAGLLKNVMKAFPINDNDFSLSKTFNAIKTLIRFIMLILIVFFFVIYYEKCFDQITSTDINEEFLSNFTKTTRKNETFLLRISFCSCFYENKYYLKSKSEIKINFSFTVTHDDVFKIISCSYIGIEAFLLAYYSYLSGKKILTNINRRNDNRSTCAIFWFCFILFFIYCVTPFVPIILSGLLFNLLSLFMDKDHSFSLKRLVEPSDSILIQIIALFTMFTLKDNLKWFCKPGLLMIKHSSSLKKLVGLSIFATLFEKAFSPLFQTIKDSSLLVDIANCSMSFLNGSQADCSSLSFKRSKVSDLSVDIKKTFSTELNMYVLDNSLLNKFFPLTILAFVLFLIFISFHLCFEKLKIYESDLGMAKIEQHLIKYYSSDSVLNKLLRKFLNNQQPQNQQSCCNKNCCKKCCKSICNWISWKWIYSVYELIFAKSDVDIALEKIRLFNQVEQIGFESNIELMRNVGDIQVPEPFVGIFPNLLNQEAAHLRVDSTMLWPYVLTFGSAYIKNSRINNNEIPHLPKSSIYTCPISRTVESTGNSTVCEYMINLNRTIEIFFRNQNSPPTVAETQHIEGLLTQISNGPVILVCDYWDRFINRLINRIDVFSHSMLNILHGKPPSFEYGEPIQTINDPQLNMTISMNPIEIVTHLEELRSEQQPPRDHLIHRFLISAPKINYNLISPQPIPMPSLLHVLLTIHIIHGESKQYDFLNDASRALFVAENTFWANKAKATLQSDFCLSQTCTYAIRNLRQLIMILKAIDNACTLIQSNQGLFTSQDISENLVRVILGISNNLNKWCFTIDQQVINRAIALNDYFIKHKLALCGYNFNPRDDIATILNQLSP